MTKSFHRASFVLLMLLAAATSGRAQTTTGRLIGSVVDESGAPLSGVNVTITSPALIGGAQTQATDDRGEFSFIGIAPGEYTVRCELTGFITQERGEVKVPLGGAAAITIAMPGGTFTGEIQVVDETPVVDPTQVNANQIFERSYMQQSAIGSSNRNYLVIVNQAAGVAGGGYWNPQPQPRVFGSTIGENAYFIDGMDTTDPMMATATVSMNFDAVEEIQLLTGGFEAEYGRATGGIVNVVTRSGGNRFSGTLDARYRDQSFQESGDHFDTSELNTSFQQVSLTLGGPILRDRLWFFGSYQWVDDEFTPIASPTTRDREGHNYLAKITWQANASWRVVGRYSTDPFNTDHWNASRWVMPEATGQIGGGTEVPSVELSAVLSDSLLWNATLGRYDFEGHGYPQSGDLQTIGHYNRDTGMSTHNYGGQEYLESTRGAVTTDLTWFIDDLAGSHELKGGIEHSDLGLSAAYCDTGTPNGERCVEDGVGFFFKDIQYEGEALPWLMWEDHTAGPLDYGGSVSTVFIQDAWRVARNLTLKIGLRYDGVTYDTNDGSEVADMGMLQPRVGVAWDITGNARNVLRASWGRFLHPNALTLPWHVSVTDEPWFIWYSCSGALPIGLGIPVGSAAECEAVAADLGWDYRLDNAGWDPYGWVLSPLEHYSSEPSQAAPDIRATHADELILAFERQIADGSSIEFTFIDKATRDIVEDTCNGNWPTPSPNAACDFYILGNIPALKRDYRGFIVRLETRSLDWLTLLASYTYSSSKGSVEYTQNASGIADNYPWQFDNIYGFLSDHRRHRLKLNGFVTLRGDWNIAFDGYWSSPFTWTPYENRDDNPRIPYGVHFLEPRGSRDASNSYQLDLQLAKGFTIGPVRLALIGSIYNAFSSEQPIAVCEHISGCGDIAMGDPTDWQTPRRYELGFRVEY